MTVTANVYIESHDLFCRIPVIVFIGVMCHHLCAKFLVATDDGIWSVD